MEIGKKKKYDIGQVSRSSEIEELRKRSLELAVGEGFEITQAGDRTKLAARMTIIGNKAGRKFATHKLSEPGKFDVVRLK